MDLARILACFAVIFVHTGANDFCQKLLIPIFHNAVPIFFMISGTNFLNKDRNLSIVMMWKKYILPLIILTISWSFLYGIYNSYITYRALSAEFLKNVIINTVNAAPHLWYIWATIGLYSITPFLKKITDNSSQKELLILEIISFSYLTALFLIKFYPFNNFESLITDLRLTFVSGFLVFYVGGCFISRLKYSKKATVFFVALGIIGYAIELLLLLCKVEGSYLTPSTVLTSFCLYWLFSRYAENFSKKHSKILMKISKKTLPIYMMHIFVIKITEHLLSLKEYGTGIAFVISVITFIVSLLLSYVLSINNLTKKLFAGK